MIENMRKYQRYIIAGLFAAAALTYFVPLLSLHTEYLDWSYSMKELMDSINKLGQAGAYMLDLFDYGDEYAQLGAVMKMRFLLYVPYILALLAACLNLFKPKDMYKYVGTIIGVINIILYFACAMWGESLLESILGYDFYMNSISIWSVLGAGYWLFILLQFLAILSCMLFLDKKEQDDAPENIENVGYVMAVEKEEAPVAKVVPSAAATVVRTGLIRGIKGEYAGMELAVREDETIVLGRDARECNLVVTGAKVSRRHCAISYFPKTNRYVLTDFSSNGTFYGDGKRVQPNTTVEVMPGTMIYLGDRENSFQIG